MGFYQQKRTAKACAIGTIMPWTGDITEIPKGWILCSGQSVTAREYPLLAQTIGSTYGQSGFGGVFPNYTGNISLPNLNDSHLADVDSNYFGFTSFTISSLSRSGTTGTASLALQHGLRPGAQFVIDGASPSGWNGTYTAVTVTNTDITFEITTAPTTPAGTAGTLKVRKTVDASVDNTTEALPTVTSYIGSDGSLGAPNLIDDAYTDIVFGYDNVNATNKSFTGRLSGANLVAGAGTKTIYASPRKLGRQHASSHGHSGSFQTVRRDDPTKPGPGVGTWGTWEATATFGYGGLDVGGVGQGQYWKVTINAPGCANDTGYNNGAAGVVLGNVAGNVINSFPNDMGNSTPNQTSTNAHPISNWLGINSDKSLSGYTGGVDGFFVPGTTTQYGGVLAKTGDGPQSGNNPASNIVPYGPGGNSINVTYRNFTPAGVAYGDGISNNATDKANEGNKILYNTNAIDFTINAASAGSVIQPHVHDSFDVEFSMGNLGLPTSINASCETSITPDNASNVGALNLTVNNAQPGMLCLYLIRAY